MPFSVESRLQIVPALLCHSSLAPRRANLDPFCCNQYSQIDRPSAPARASSVPFISRLLTATRRSLLATCSRRWKSLLALTVLLVVSSGPLFAQNSLPTGWTDGDIGSVGVAGSATFASGVFTVQGAGNTLGVSADGFHFVYQALSGNGTIVARVASTSSTYAQVGVMIRETLTAGSNHMFMGDYEGTIYDIYRTTTGSASSYGTGGAGTLPYWVEVVRSGNTFTGYRSADGVNWVQVASETITMAQDVYIGLAVASGSTSTAYTATFDNVSINSSANPAPQISGISATTASVGAR
jgi:regulation of enolase protein 1 (concanavalin A-like superfamily)